MIENRMMLESVLESLQALSQPQVQNPAQSAVIAEAFDRVRAMLQREDKGWVALFGGTEGEPFGLRLNDLKAWDRKISESTIGAPWLKRGFGLRHSYISQNGIRYGDIPEGGKQGVKNLRAIIDRPGNQLHFYGDEARKRREHRLYCSGFAGWIGNDKTKNLISVPLRQITDQFLDPEGLGLIWAYKREWTERDPQTGKTTPKKMWYFTDQFAEHRKGLDSIGELETSEEVPVSQDHTFFDMHANRADGLAYGSPDALAAWVWNGIARDGFMDGTTMQAALATFAFKITNKSAAGGRNAALEMADRQGAGSTAVMGQNDLAAMASAGKGYDFSSLYPLTSIIATSLDIPNIALLSDTSAAGSSYGAAQTLDLPTRLAMESRRAEHVNLDQRVLRWMDVKSPDVFYIPYATGEETYRASQALILEYQNDLYSRQELRDYVDDLHGRPNGKVPTEAKRPSALAAKALADATPSANTGSAADGEQPVSVASPAQGRSNGTGGQSGASNDIRR